MFLEGLHRWTGSFEHCNLRKFEDIIYRWNRAIGIAKVLHPNFDEDALGRSSGLTKHAISKSVVISRLLLTAHTNSRFFFSSALSYCIIYTDIINK